MSYFENVSKMFSLSVRNVVHALFMSVTGAIVLGGYEIFQHKGFDGWTIEDVKAIAVLGVSAGFVYLIKKFFTDENGKLFGTM